MQRLLAHCFIEDVATSDLLRRALADRRLSKVVAGFRDGGLEAARTEYAGSPSPPLLIVDAGRSSPDMILEKVDALAEVCVAGTNLVLLGMSNDVGLYRALTRKGVADYLALPLDPEQIVQALLDVVAGPGRVQAGRVIAFYPVKGGVGSSVLAHNIAWLLSRPVDTDAVVIDLDMPFGSADLNFNVETASGVRNLLAEPERIDQALLERFATRYDERLHLLAAPATLDQTTAVDAARLEAVLDAVRQNYRTVVIDLPHAWNAGVQQVLRMADAVVLVALPDLPGLRNTRNLFDWLIGERPGSASPLLALNFADGDRRAQIEVADFVESLGRKPTVTIPVDADAFRFAAAGGKMIGEVRPKSKAARALHQLAEALAPPGIARTPGKARGGSLLARLFGGKSKT